MAGAIGILRELHRLRRHIASLQEEMNRTPLRIKAQASRLTRQEEDLKAARDALQHVKVGIKENEVSLKEAHQHIAKLEAQPVNNKKEYDALRNEVANERKKCGEIEQAILEGMIASDEQSARIPEVEKALKAGKDELARFEAAAKERLATLTQELQQTQAQLREVETTLPEHVRKDYNRLVAAMGEEALSLAKNNTCSACYSALTAQQQNDLAAGRLVLCKSCGRIVYLADEAI
ncbi:MAG TPA: C4-type zinc ribbon domain-containing protein [Gemmataceae bacterium]|nr:C4-type zinc ribbon domain-containing protein [Gemmataceae bacterium]